jgi:hypothetical protein
MQADGTLYPIPVKVTNKVENGLSAIKAMSVSTATATSLVKRQPLTASRLPYVQPCKRLPPNPKHCHSMADPLLSPAAAAPAQVGHVRRFFYIDASLGKGTIKSSSASSSSSGSTAAVQAVQYPSAMKLSITLRGDAKDRIYPPVLTLR